MSTDRIEKHKALLQKAIEVTGELIDLQEEKFKIICDFLEYEEALTQDKETATRIKNILNMLGIWPISTTR